MTKNAIEIDHFVPQRIAPERENDYSNLVYACYECNRKKSGKWPSEEEARSYIEISVTLRALQNLLFENKE